jgi:hypothetical protein
MLLALGLLMLLAIPAALEFSTGDTERTASSEKGTSDRSLPAERQPRLVSAGRTGKAPLSKQSPVMSLPANLRKVVADFETLAVFLDSSEGFTMEEFESARKDCRSVIDTLQADEVSTLIHFYEDPATAALRLNGRDLAETLLYRRWGQIDSATALAWIRTRLQKAVAGAREPVDLKTPSNRFLATFTDFIFEGWASENPEEARAGWRELFGSMKSMDAVLTNLDELDAAVTKSIEAGASGKAE